MIELAYKGHVAILKMIHGKANALDLELCEAVLKRLDQLKTSSAQAVILTGQGKIFSAGVDLLRAMDGGPDYVREFLPVLCRAFERLFFYPKPVVAAVNGHAIAGGCVLACAADRRLMARDCGRIGVTELLVGLPFPPIALEIMRFAAAPPRLTQIICTGATYPPQAAVDLGLIDEVVDAEALIDRAVDAAESLAALRPEAFALTKRQIRQPALERLQQDGPRYGPEVDASWTAPETSATIRDYVTRTFRKG